MRIDKLKCRLSRRWNWCLSTSENVVLSQSRCGAEVGWVTKSDVRQKFTVFFVVCGVLCPTFLALRSAEAQAEPQNNTVDGVHDV